MCPSPAVQLRTPRHGAGRSIGGGERAHGNEPRSTPCAPRGLGRRSARRSPCLRSQAITSLERDMSGSEKPDLSGALAVGRKLDLILPDSRAVRDAYAEAEAESQPWLFNHVMRSWLYGAKLAQRRGLAPDAELVALAECLSPFRASRWGATALRAARGAGGGDGRCRRRRRQGSIAPPPAARARRRPRSRRGAPRPAPATPPRSSRARAGRSPATGSPALCCGDCASDGRGTADGA